MLDHWKKGKKKSEKFLKKIESNEFLDREISDKTMQARNHYPQNKTNCSRNFGKITMAASGFNKNVNPWRFGLTDPISVAEPSEAEIHQNKDLEKVSSFVFEWIYLFFLQY